MCAKRLFIHAYFAYFASQELVFKMNKYVQFGYNLS